MNIASRTLSLRLVFCLVGFVSPAICIRASVTNLVWFRLGENDAGAAPGVAATSTRNLLTSLQLTAFGSPLYTDAVSTAASNAVESSLAMQFSGSHQYLSNSAVTPLINNFSIEAWVKPNTVGTGVRMIAYDGNTALNGWGIFQSGTNYFGFIGGSPGTIIGVSNGVATAGTWTHVALVRVAGTSGFFINGALNGATTTVSPVSPTVADSFAIGALPQSPSSDDFNGAIDEVRICSFNSTLFKNSDFLVNVKPAATQSGILTSSSSATLNGGAQTASLNSSAWFDWGTTTNYGNSTEAQSISKLIASTNFTDSISNLLDGVTYQFRAVVSNALGVAYGTNLSIPVPQLQVTNTTDSGPGSLRDAISNAAPGDTITFAAGVAGIIALTSGPIIISNSVSILGPGTKAVSLTSADFVSVLEFTGGNSFLSGVTISGGGSGSVDAAVANSANLTVSNCQFISNFGAALQHSSNNLVILNSAFINNNNGNGGLVIATNATASVTNCTFIGNGASSGGAIDNQGQLNLICCTIAFNTSGTSNNAVYSAGTTTVGNCIIAKNFSFTGSVFGPGDVGGNFVSLGYNFIGAVNGSTGFTNGVHSDHAGTIAAPIDPLLNFPAGYYGGQTMNMVPAIASPVIDSGYSFGAVSDQRGFARPLDFWQVTNAAGGDGSDIGAAEYGSSIWCSNCAGQITIDASQTLRPADGRWFGANTATWETAFDSASTTSMLNEMGVTTLRYPGGSLADTYHWSSNYWVGGTPHVGPTAFNNFAHIATNLAGVNVFITVNYGTGTTNEAADWVRSVNITNHCGFKYWEVGNENYFGIEADQNTNPPFMANEPWTYATRFCDYYRAMKAADPTIKVGAVILPGEDTFNSSPHEVVNPRTGLSHNGWASVMLATMKSNNITPDFLVHHFYPCDAPSTENDPELLQEPLNWAYDAAEYRQEISDYIGDAGTNIELLCTENNSEADFHQGKQSTSLVNGLYLADGVGRLMQTEFSSYLWWIFESHSTTSGGNFSSSLYGWRTFGDFGLALDVNTKYPTFYAMKLMHDFVQPGDTILNTGAGYPFLDVFAAIKTNGTLSVLFINKDRTNTFSRQIMLNNFSQNAGVTVRSYGIPQDEATRTNGPLAMQDIATSQMTVAGGGFNYNFPPYSMTLFTLVPIGPTLKASPSGSGIVIVSWPFPSAGWNLLQSTDLTTANWTTPLETIQNDGTNNFILISPPIGNRFFELTQP